MAYNSYFPAGYQPVYPQNYLQNYPQAPQQNGVTWVQGIEGAKAHPVNAGQSALLMDSEGDCFYLKSADQSGMPTLRIFDYKERTDSAPEPKNADLSAFLTKEELSPYATKADLKKAISELKSELKKGKKKDE